MRSRGSIAATVIVCVALGVVGAGVVSSLAVYHGKVRSAELSARELTQGAAAAKKGPYVGVITDNVTSFDKAIHAQANLTVQYLAWGRPISEVAITQAAKSKMQILTALEPRKIRLKNIVAGKYDAYLKTMAERIVRTRQGVLLSFGPEMNGRWYTWGYGHVTPQLFVQAYRHVHDVISKIAGKQVTWVWQVSHIFSSSEPLKLLFPGSKYVSVIGVDAYFEQKSDTFTSQFGDTVRYLRKFTKTPIFISETAIGQDAGKAAKIPQLFAGIRRWHLRGLVWFEHSQHNGVHHQDWLLEGNPAALAAYRTGLKSIGVKVK
jgi:mannan endo-1,4-beta-mannosidase